MARPTCPTERDEARELVYWLRRRCILFSHIANEVWTKAQGIANARAGVSPGVPDYLIVLPNRVLCFIELKRRSGGRTSAEQKEWIRALSEAGTPARVCRGATESIAWLQELCPELCP